MNFGWAGGDLYTLPRLGVDLEAAGHPVQLSVRHTDEPQSGRNSCLWLFHLLDDWGGDHWLPQIGPRVPLSMVSVILTWSGWHNI